MTNQLCLQQQCGRLYKKLLQQLAGYKTTPADEKKWIEWGFGLTIKIWLNIQEEVAGYAFNDQQEEITFFKVLKPKFIGLMDYFTHLYKSALFQPEGMQEKKDYWNHELVICNNFLSKHVSFCRYYEQGNTSMDHIYFMRENNQHALVFGINETGRHAITSHSYLLARILSTKKYQHYIQEKICALTNARSN